MLGGVHAAYREIELFPPTRIESTEKLEVSTSPGRSRVVWFEHRSPLAMTGQKRCTA